MQTCIFVNEYCYNVNVMVYIQRNEERKERMKKVSEVSRLAGVSKRTLQYYDDEGLILAQRSSNNYRLYDDAALERVWEILIYREMDIELKEIKSLLGLPESERKKFLSKLILNKEKQIDDLEEKVRFMNDIKKNGIPKIPLGLKFGRKTYVEQIHLIKEGLKRR